MNAPARLSVRAYPTKRAIAHAIKAHRDLVGEVGGYEISPDGTIRVFSPQANPRAGSLFDQLETAGKL